MQSSSIQESRSLGLFASALALLGGFALGTPATAQQTAPGRARAPVMLKLSGGTAWINTAGPIHERDLKGKIVLLDFWTYCCINCHHVLPDLAKLEQKYRNELVVIGVHTPKFEAEKKTANVREKVREYGIKHPVVSDSEHAIWNHFGVESWPTIGVFDAKGELVFATAGEGHYAELDKAVGEAVEKARAEKILDESPINFHLEDEKIADDSPLRFPGKIFADAAGNRLFVSDTGHNRIVISDLKGKVEAVIGDGSPALKDGDFATSEFNRPQGICLVDDVLYVADTENHAIRAVDLKAKTVTTISGNGSLSNRRTGAGPAKTTGLNSPWDIVQIPGTKELIVAMAGPHQLWKLDLAAGTIGVWAGTGMENIEDGRLRAASFAQPSGLATDGKHVFVADSEGSAVRAISLDSSQEVATLVGLHDVDNVLFLFGDADGPGPRARLQHCLGVAFGDGKLYIADTYNNKIKAVDLQHKTVKTLVGAHQPGATDKPPLFYQPGGLSVAGGSLYVADTNNSAIRVVDLATKDVTTLALDGLKPPSSGRTPLKFPRAVVVNTKPAKVAPGADLELDVTIDLPSGIKVNPERPIPYAIQAPGHEELIPSELAEYGAKLSPPSSKFAVKVPLSRPLKAGESLTLKLLVSAFVCKSGSEGFCKVDNIAWNIPIVVADGGEAKISVSNAK